MLQFHPAFVPGYARVGMELLSDSRGRWWIEDCDALNEGDRHSWFALLDAASHPALDATVQAVNPRARCVPVQPSGAARLAWDIVVDAAADPAPEPPEVASVRSTGTARFAFTERALRP